MSRSVDAISEMEYLERRVCGEAPELLMRSMRIVEDPSLAEKLVLDSFRRLWKFRDRYGLERPMEEVCIGQCIRYLNTTDTRQLDDSRRGVYIQRFRQPLTSEENHKIRQIDPRKLWHGVQLLLDDDERRRGKHLANSKVWPNRFVVYIAGLALVFALLLTYLARNTNHDTLLAPGTLTVRTAGNDTTDLLFLNNVRVWLLPNTEVIYPDDLGVTPLEMTVIGEVLVLVPEGTKTPVVIRSEGQTFRLDKGHYRFQISDDRRSASLHVRSGKASWMQQTKRREAVEIRGGQVLHLQIQDADDLYAIIDTTEQDSWKWPL